MAKGENEFAATSCKSVHSRVCLKLPLPAALYDNDLPLPRAMKAIGLHQLTRGGGGARRLKCSSFSKRRRKAAEKQRKGVVRRLLSPATDKKITEEIGFGSSLHRDSYFLTA